MIQIFCLQFCGTGVDTWLKDDSFINWATMILPRMKSWANQIIVKFDEAS
jgi:hypothetical protein